MGRSQGGVDVRDLAVFQITPADAHGLERGCVVGKRQSKAAQVVVLSVKLLAKPDCQYGFVAVTNRLGQLEDRRVTFIGFRQHSPTRAADAINRSSDSQPCWLKSADGFRNSIGRAGIANAATPRR